MECVCVYFLKIDLLNAFSAFYNVITHIYFFVLGRYLC